MIKDSFFKKGMTLVELIVAIAILSLGMGVFTYLSIKAWSFKGYALEQATATTSATRVITQMVHEIRTVSQAQDGSYPVAEVSDYSLTVYLDDDNDGFTERVHYFLVGEELKKGVTKYISGSYASEDGEIKTILNYVTNGGKPEPLFYYYGNNYPVGTGTHMDTPNAYDVRLIRIHLWLNIKPIVAPENVNLESFVELRNLNEI
ncbi:MAG: hypothetical protein ACD_56C00165G0006 [uncultured bacterium]|nr:MAG: hypothetical protein ACD_56C00165G0006 [uncultured bacterium]